MTTKDRVTAAANVTVTVFRVPRDARPEDLCLLAPDEAARAGRFRFVSDRASYVTTRAVLRRCLGAALGIAPTGIRLVTGAHGRPGLHPSHGATIDFNVSHSVDHSAIALSPAGRVGVDIETHGRIPDIRSLVPTVMGPGERLWLEAADSTAALDAAFYACWTRKEAMLKAIGTGLIDDLTTLDVPPQPVTGVLECPGTAVPRWQVTTCRVTSSCTLSVMLAGAGVIAVPPVIDAAQVLP